MEKGSLILTAKGLNTKMGLSLIAKALEKESLENKKIYLVSLPEYEIGEKLMQACVKIGFKEANITVSSECYPQNEKMDYIYVGEAIRTAELGAYMQRFGIMPYIVECMNAGAVYIGASAGAMVASTPDYRLCKNIDSGFVSRDPNYANFAFTGLCLLDGTIIPHYTEEQLQAYVKTKSDYELSGYEHIYSVANDEAIIIENGCRKVIKFSPTNL